MSHCSDKMSHSKVTSLVICSKIKGQCHLLSCPQTLSGQLKTSQENFCFQFFLTDHSYYCHKTYQKKNGYQILARGSNKHWNCPISFRLAVHFKDSNLTLVWVQGQMEWKCPCTKGCHPRPNLQFFFNMVQKAFDPPPFALNIMLQKNLTAFLKSDKFQQNKA